MFISATDSNLPDHGERAPLRILVTFRLATYCIEVCTEPLAKDVRGLRRCSRAEPLLSFNLINNTALLSWIVTLQKIYGHARV